MHLILSRPAKASTSSPGAREQVEKPGGIFSLNKEFTVAQCYERGDPLAILVYVYMY